MWHPVVTNTVETLVSDHLGNSEKWSQLELVAYESGRKESFVRSLLLCVQYPHCYFHRRIIQYIVLRLIIGEHHTVMVLWDANLI